MKNKISTIHLGADLLPKGSGDYIANQRVFIEGYLKDFFKRAAEAKIKILCYFGNDDIYALKPLFREYGSLLDEKPEKIGHYEFKAYGFVPDYIFGLKTACKLDRKGWKCPEQYISTPKEATDRVFTNIEDVEQYFKDKGTIQEDLEKITVDQNTVMAIHTPPANCGLDVCGTKFYGEWVASKRVGSNSVYQWAIKAQPKILLCGHIHESPECSNGKWMHRIGKTLVIQPGQQENKTTMVIIKIGYKTEAEIIYET